MLFGHAPSGDVRGATAAPENEPGRILMRVFETLDNAAIGYCVLHGYEDYPGHVPSDVDCVIDAGTSAERVLALLSEHRDSIGAEVVGARGYYIVLSNREMGRDRCFLTLDLGTHCDSLDLPLYDGCEILSSRRRRGAFWIPGAALAFGAYLCRCIAKQKLDPDRAARLSRLYADDPEGCAKQVARFWPPASADLIIAAARSGDWHQARTLLVPLARELRRSAIRRRFWRWAGNRLRALRARMARVIRPAGVSVVLLGPDGAGKSSVIEAIGPRLAPVFPQWTCRGFAPPLFRRLRRGLGTSTSEPHRLAARSLPTSLVRLAYWFAYYMLSFVALRMTLARSTLILYDRHFLDIFVDPTRYRYGGPRWMLRALWRVVPKPDLVILLDAPAAVLQARKQEVPFEVTQSQREQYLQLVRSLPNGRIVDASAPLSHVLDEVAEIVLRHSVLRRARRIVPEEVSGTRRGRKRLAPG